MISFALKITDMTKNTPKIAILIPCFNEELSIAKVVEDFAKRLPQAQIFVGDNNCTDKTVQIARNNGAKVIFDSRKGKGNIVQTMFRNIQADHYILVDGDNTYNALEIQSLLQPVLDGHFDMVVGNRLFRQNYKLQNKRRFHSFGNILVTGMVNWIFGSNLKDIMSGYRVFSQKMVKNLAILSKGFELETEITLNALDSNFRILEIPIGYKARTEGSQSKLKTFEDGFRVLFLILTIFKDYRPLLFYGIFMLLFFILGTAFVSTPILEYFKTGLVGRFPSLFAGLSFFLVSVVFLAIGLILDTQKKYYKLLNGVNINKM